VTNFRKTLSGDIFGGITAGVVALPLALAFGVQSGMGAIAGIYGAIFVGFFAAIFGGTNTQITGPTGPMTVLSAMVIMQAVTDYGSLQQALPMILMTFALVGVFQVVFGVIRLGDYIKYIPYPVISGFMTGIGIIIILLQIYPMLGHSAPTKVIQVFTQILTPLSAIGWQSLSLALVTIVVIYVFPRITQKIPSTLVALLALTVVSTLLNFDVAVIGDIPKGLPHINMAALGGIDFTIITAALVPALTIAAIGAIDSLLTSVIADNMTKTSHKSNKELVGQGIGNFIGALFGGLPSAGATMRTVVNIRSGGKTKLSGVIHSALLLLVLLGAGEYASKIPLPVLAGILITVGISIIDYKGFRHILNVPKSDAAIIILVTTLTVFVNLLYAVAAGIVVACIMFMKKMSEITEENSKVTPIEDMHKEEAWDDEAIMSQALENKIYIKHLVGPLFFGFTSHFHGLAKSIPDVKFVIIRMKLVPYIDQSGLYAIEDVYDYLTSKGIAVYITGLQQQPKEMLEDTNIIPEKIPRNHVFSEFEHAMHELEKVVTSGT